MTPEVIVRVDAWLMVTPRYDAFLALRNEWEFASGRWRGANAHGWELAGREAALTGILLALVREAWGDPTITTRANGFNDIPWGCCSRGGELRMRRVWFPTEADALVTALEAAPAKVAE